MNATYEILISEDQRARINQALNHLRESIEKAGGIPHEELEALCDMTKEGALQTGNGELNSFIH